ncbi:hypothetical protein LEP1GSC051_4214 [Leptospira sp. P2653]|nr:hypothetical protein LEP1GSC051_4214 [Leptospira sp. P2653]
MPYFFFRCETFANEYRSQDGIFRRRTLKEYKKEQYVKKTFERGNEISLPGKIK